MHNTDENVALMKDLMKTPPMSAAQHASIMRKRIEVRRLVEDAREISRLRAGDLGALR